MNNTRNLIILVVVLVVLGGISLLQRSSHHRQTSRAATEILDEIKAGADFAEAADLANHAAGLAVRELGTATVTTDELIAALNEKDQD